MYYFQKFLRKAFQVCNLLLILTGISFSSSWEEVIPKPYPLFTIHYCDDNLPEDKGKNICKIYDFENSCAKYDGACRTRKGKCGEILSGEFFNANKSWERLEGTYKSIHGFDGFFRIINEYEEKHYIVIEDKADTARLSSKNKQMSLKWQEDVIREVFSSDEPSNFTRLNKEETDDFIEGLYKGRVTNFLTRTLYRNLKHSLPPMSSSNTLTNHNLSPPSDFYNRNSTSGSFSGRTPVSSSRLKHGKSNTSSCSGGRTSYTFQTTVSLAGSLQWNVKFKNDYIRYYQDEIHNDFGAILNNHRDHKNCMITQDKVSSENFDILSRTEGKYINFM